MKTKRFFTLRFGMIIDLDSVFSISESSAYGKHRAFSIQFHLKEKPVVVKISNYYAIEHSSSDAITDSFNEDQDNLINAWKDYKLEAAKQVNVNLRDELAKSALTGLLANPKYFNPEQKHLMIMDKYIFTRAYKMADGMLRERTHRYGYEKA